MNTLPKPGAFCYKKSDFAAFQNPHVYTSPVFFLQLLVFQGGAILGRSISGDAVCP